MNQEIKDKLLWRATIFENAGGIINSSNKTDKRQLSLFDEVKSETISLSVPENIDYEEWVQKEINVLGISLIYNIQDKYILYFKRFCNTNLREIEALKVDSKELIFIAKLKDIEYKTSKAGNSYAKIVWFDGDILMRMYLFGDNYKKLIGDCIKGKYYLAQCSFNSSNGNSSLDKLKCLDQIDISKYINTIQITVNKPESIVELRDYIWKNMIGSDFNLIFIYKNQEFKAPYKIKFNEDNYLDIKNLIINLDVKYEKTL